jgi:hypothetical protein
VLSRRVGSRERANVYPHWGRNHLMWGEALARLGRADEAQAQYRADANLDLSAADRATLASLLKAG